MTDPRLAYAPVVGIVALWLYWRHRQSTRDARLCHAGVNALPGLIVIAFFAALHVFAAWADITCFKPISLLGITSGLLLASGGYDLLKRHAGLMGWLLFLVPLPTTLTSGFQFWMQMTSSGWAALFCGLCGIPIQREGVQLFVVPNQSLPPTYSVLVAQPCSGLVSLFALLAIAYLLALLTPAVLWARIVLVFAAIPSALLANSLRITLIVTAATHHSLRLAEWLHANEEPVLVFLCTMLLLGLRSTALIYATYISNSHIGVSHVGVSQVNAAQVHTSQSHAVRTADSTRSSALLSTNISASLPARFPLLQRYARLIVNFLFVAALSGSFLLGRLENASDTYPDFLINIPLDFHNWRGTPVTISKADIAALDPDSYLMQSWSSPASRSLELTVIAGHRKRSIHTPAFCLRGDGWEPLDSSSRTLSISGRSVTMTSLRMIRDGQCLLVSYFFSDGDYCTTDLLELQMRQFWSRMRGGENEGSLVALIRVVVPCKANDQRAAGILTDDFAQATFPIILARLRGAQKIKSQ